MIKVMMDMITMSLTPTSMDSHFSARNYQRHLSLRVWNWLLPLSHLRQSSKTPMTFQKYRNIWMQFIWRLMTFVVRWRNIPIIIHLYTGNHGTNRRQTMREYKHKHKISIWHYSKIRKYPPDPSFRFACLFQ